MLRPFGSLRVKTATKLTLSHVDSEESLLLRLQSEAHRSVGGINEGEGARDVLTDAAVAELYSLFGNTFEDGLARRQLRRIQTSLHHS